MQGFRTRMRLPYFWLWKWRDVAVGLREFEENEEYHASQLQMVDEFRRDVLAHYHGNFSWNEYLRRVTLR
jgi:hypothetical protein